MLSRNRTDFSKIGERHRMATARVHATLDVHTRDLLTAVILQSRFQLADVQISLKGFVRDEIQGSLRDNIDNLSAVRLNMIARRGKKHVPWNHGTVSHVEFHPDALRCSALHAW